VFDRQLQVERAEAAYDRSSDRSGVARQAGAVIGATDRSAGLAALDVATLVIHGNRDPLIDISGGRRTAELVPNARFVEVDGMGHDLTPCFWKIFTDAVAEHLRTIEPALGSRA
jgi:pimeloyl-ACP methyl ester carboxylesterase